MTVEYNPNIPQFTDSYASWQTNFLSNFMQINTAFSVNHEPISSTNAGNHTIIQLPEQENPVQTNINEISVYSKDVPGQTDQVFMKFPGINSEFQYTNYQIYPVNGPSTQTSYFTFLPGKVIVYFGQTTANNVKTIQLLPPVAKNIITVNLTNMSLPNSQGTPISFTVTNNIVTTVNLNRTSVTDMNYIVLANI
jgi:hypothetical protein